MDESAVCRLTDANESLKNEIWDLRETAANLDTEKQEIITQTKSMKEQNRSLEAKIDCFQAMAEDFLKEEEELQGMLRQLEETIAQLESQNGTLKTTNKMLRTEIQTVSGHIVSFQDYKAVQEQDVVRMKQVLEHIVTYFKQLEGKIETAEQRYEEERTHSIELKRTLEELEQIREVQENEIFCLTEQLEEASLLKSESGGSVEYPSLLHEMVQAKLVQDSLAMQNSILFLLSKVLWLVMVAVLCLGFLNFSVKLYIFIFNRDLEPSSQALLFSGRFSLLSEILYPHRAKKPNGLLPF
ncbi:transmembrane and coiled-coil domain-containing protein 5B-like [Anolis sagrei]|uniref:transmembrane and coiled-coil domain-containing protein 5B-like n=1 Tax=Anolis sagrei TaxID=38937 RepID=UPI0035202384